MDDAQSCYGSSGRDEGRNDGVGELDRLPTSIFFRLTSVCKRWKSGASSPSFKLASITTDEDLDNMVEEYDHTAFTFPYKPFRLRLFLFFVKPETTASMGVLLDDAKLSEVLAQGDFFGDNNKQGNNVVMKNVDNVVVHDVHLINQDFLFVENSTSSYGSSTSSPCLSNLPPIQVRMGENRARLMQGGNRGVGIEEQFAQISASYPIVVAALPPMVANLSDLPPSGGKMMNASGVSGGNVNRVDDERSSDQSMSVGFRKPPLPLPLQPLQVNKAVFYIPSAVIISDNNPSEKN
ncbi:hypothetical protein ACFX2J_000387 [Malus domestica]